MKFECGSCGKRYNVADEKVPKNGAKVRCKSCGGVILIPPVDRAVVENDRLEKLCQLTNSIPSDCKDGGPSKPSDDAGNADEAKQLSNSVDWRYIVSQVFGLFNGSVSRIESMLARNFAAIPAIRGKEILAAKTTIWMFVLLILFSVYPSPGDKEKIYHASEGSQLGELEHRKASHVDKGVTVKQAEDASRAEMITKCGSCTWNEEALAASQSYSNGYIKGLSYGGDVSRLELKAFTIENTEFTSPGKINRLLAILSG